MGHLRGVCLRSLAALGLVASLIPNPPAQAQIAEPAISGLVKQYEAAFHRCDAAALAPLMGERFTGFGVRGGLAKSRDVGDLRKQCADGYRFALNFSVLHTENIGAQHSLAVGMASGTVTAPDGKIIAANLKFSWVLTMEGERLVILHSHLSQRN